MSGDFPLAARNCERIPKTRVSRFLRFYLLISPFQALACENSDRARRDLSIGDKNAQFHGMWLGIEPFLCFSISYCGCSVDWKPSCECLMMPADFSFGVQNCEKIPKTKVSRFLAFYPLISSFQALACGNSDRARRDLSIGVKNAQFHAVRLGIEPFLSW